MTKEILASTLNGITLELFEGADFEDMEKDGLVIITGFSDDLICAQGAIKAEETAMAELVYIDKEGFLTPPDYLDELEGRHEDLMKWCNRMLKAHRIEIVDISPWNFKTEIPHAVFGIYDVSGIYEDKKTVCHGIIIDIKDL